MNTGTVKNLTVDKLSVKTMGKRNDRDINIIKGNWGGWTKKWCPDNEYVCGLSVRNEGEQGAGDDVGINGISLRCCSFT